MDRVALRPARSAPPGNRLRRSCSDRRRGGWARGSAARRGPVADRLERIRVKHRRGRQRCTRVCPRRPRRSSRAAHRGRSRTAHLKGDFRHLLSRRAYPHGKARCDFRDRLPRSCRCLVPWLVYRYARSMKLALFLIALGALAIANGCGSTENADNGGFGAARLQAERKASHLAEARVRRAAARRAHRLEVRQEHREEVEDRRLAGPKNANSRQPKKRKRRRKRAANVTPITAAPASIQMPRITTAKAVVATGPTTPAKSSSWEKITTASMPTAMGSAARPTEACWPTA